MKMQERAKFLIALAIVTSWPFVAVVAQNITPENASSSTLYFPNMDKNHDGFVSRSEVPKEMHELRVHFDQYDLNKDHRLSVAEYSSYLNTLAAGDAGACNSTQQNVKDSSCGGMTGLRDTQPRIQADTRSSYTPVPRPSPPPTAGH